jgi:PsbP-like protein
MRLNNWIIAPCFLATMFMGCNSSTKVTNNEYIDNKSGMKMAFPKNWNFDTTEFVLREELENANDDYQERIVIGYEIFPTKIRAEEFAKANATQFALLDSSIKIISSAKLAVKNVEAFKTIMEKEDQTNQKIISYVVIKDSFHYTLQAITDKASFVKHEPIFDSIISSIQFIK